MSFLHLIFDTKTIIATVGAIGVIAIIFCETGLFFGFFLPGDSLLFTSGYFASQGHLNLAILIFGCALAAIIGDSVGYGIGKKVGPVIFSRDNSVLFNKKHLFKAKDFYEKHGKKTIILARFIPIIRTFAPLVAGMGGMNYRIFFLYNIVGGIGWTFLLLILGYGFGNLIPNPDRYIIPAVIIIIVISAIPAIKEIIQKAKDSQIQ